MYKRNTSSCIIFGVLVENSLFCLYLQVYHTLICLFPDGGLSVPAAGTILTIF